jgi:hypothetical protein
VAAGKRGGGREGHRDGRRRLRGLPFAAASFHFLGSIHERDLGLPRACLGQRSVGLFRLPGAGRQCGDYWIGMNKGRGPRVPSRTKMGIYRMPASMDLAGVSCFGRLCLRTPLGVSCLEIAGSDRIWSEAPEFLSDHLVSEGVLQRSASCYHLEARFLVPW